MPLGVALATVPTSVLGNDGTVFTVHIGRYNEIFPDHVPLDQSVVALDIQRPDEAVERVAVPAAVGPGKKISAGLLYSKETGRLNVLWETRTEDEVGVLLAGFDGTGWSSANSIYHNSSGTRPTLAVTSDDYHLNLEGHPSLDVDREILHIVWPQETDQEYELGYSPVVVLNGVYIGAQETLVLPHLNPNANGVGNNSLAARFHITVKDDDGFDRVTLTFASSITGLATTYNVQITPLEIVHFGDLIREFVLAAEADINPEDIANFADMLGVHIIDIGRRRTLRSRSVLRTSVLEYVASGSSQYILDHGAAYDADQIEALADDVRRKVLELSSSLYSPDTAVAATAQHKSSQPMSSLLIDVGSEVEDQPTANLAHVLELGFATEIALPDTGEGEMDLFTSEDGRRFLVSWSDTENPDLLWYLESELDETWSEARSMRLTEALTLEQAHHLLEQRISH